VVIPFNFGGKKSRKPRKQTRKNKKAVSRRRNRQQ
jgi:hypothetical protein